MSATYPQAHGRANAFAGHGAWLLMIIRNVSKPPLLTRENSPGQSRVIARDRPEPTHTRIGFAFEPGHWDGEPAIGEPAKCSQLVWADPGSLPSDTVQYTTAIIRAVQHGATFALNGWWHLVPGRDRHREASTTRAASRAPR